jgi:hypothetical protein
MERGGGDREGYSTMNRTFASASTDADLHGERDLASTEEQARAARWWSFVSTLCDLGGSQKRDTRRRNQGRIDTLLHVIYLLHYTLKMPQVY